MLRLCYSYNMGGISNQKLALFGLFHTAYISPGVGIILPNIMNFDQIRVNVQDEIVPISDVFEIGPLRDFADRQGIEIVEEDPVGGLREGWRYFGLGIGEIARARISGDISAQSFACEFFRSLVPVETLIDVAKMISNEVYFNNSIVNALQLRLEADWEKHVQTRLAASIGRHENNGVSLNNILKKIHSSFGETGNDIYVVGDEDHLVLAKNEIQKIADSEFGIKLRWKSDFINKQELSSFSLLQKSIIDFEIAIRARSFVGLSRSTFSGLLCFEKFARTGNDVERHYIYNSFDPGVALRRDNGAFSCVALATAVNTDAPECAFYGAQVLEEVGDLQSAIERYRCAASEIRIDPEIRYLSFYHSAKLEDRLGRPSGVMPILAAYLEANKLGLPRAEAALAAARIYREQRKYGEGYNILEPVTLLKVPLDQIFVDSQVYEWALADEFAVHASWVGKYWSALSFILLALGSPACPSDQRSRMIGNVKFCLQRLLGDAERAARKGSNLPSRNISIEISED